jgi:N-acetylmuramoyl-L-alanine amidase
MQMKKLFDFFRSRSGRSFDKLRMNSAPRSFRWSEANGEIGGTNEDLSTRLLRSLGFDAANKSPYSPQALRRNLPIVLSKRKRVEGGERREKHSFKRNLLLFLCIPCTSYAWLFNIPSQKPFVILLEAGGDISHPGRSINDSFESSITYEIVQAIKQIIILQCPPIKVLLNRTQTETILLLQNANFANKLDIDCYISIHAFAETQIKPRIFIYQFSYHDDFIAKDGLSFYPFDKIYLINQKQTNTWAQQLKQALEKNSLWMVNGVYAFPFKPLIGIKVPAIGIEIGIKNRSEWRDSVDALVNGIIAIINCK